MGAASDGVVSAKVARVAPCRCDLLHNKETQVTQMAGLHTILIQEYSYPGRVRHSVATYGQRLLCCDQSMRKKAWCSRKRHTLLAGVASELAGAARLRHACGKLRLLAHAHSLIRYDTKQGSHTISIHNVYKYTSLAMHKRGIEVL